MEPEITKRSVYETLGLSEPDSPEEAEAKEHLAREARESLNDHFHRAEADAAEIAARRRLNNMSESLARSGNGDSRIMTLTAASDTVLESIRNSLTQSGNGLSGFLTADADSFSVSPALVQAQSTLASITSSHLRENRNSGITYSSGSGIEVARPPELLLGQAITRLMETRPDNAKEYEANDELLGLCRAWDEHRDQQFRLGFIGDKLIDLGYPQDDIRIVILMKYQHLWQSDWWPTCLAKL